MPNAIMKVKKLKSSRPTQMPNAINRVELASFNLIYQV